MFLTNSIASKGTLPLKNAEFGFLNGYTKSEHPPAKSVHQFLRLIFLFRLCVTQTCRVLSSCLDISVRPSP